MKKTDFGCWGHAYNRKFFYTASDGRLNDFTVPGGAALVQKLLNSNKLAEYKPLDKSYRCEHIECY